MAENYLKTTLIVPQYLDQALNFYMALNDLRKNRALINALEDMLATDARLMGILATDDSLAELRAQLVVNYNKRHPNAEIR